MPEKTFGTPVDFVDYAWKDMNEIIAHGLTLGVVSQAQQTGRYVSGNQRDQMLGGNMQELATAISNYAGMTADYIYVSWNEQYSGQDEYGNDVWLITDLYIGAVATVVNANNGNSIVGAMDYVDWYHNFVLDAIPGYLAYVINPCPAGYHWDAGSQACVPDSCPIGYHWDADTQQCVIDTPTNCPVGTHWDATAGRCVVDEPPNDDNKFPWVPVLIGVGAATAIGVGGYYIYTRKKRRKTTVQPAPTLYSP